MGLIRRKQHTAAAQVTSQAVLTAHLILLPRLPTPLTLEAVRVSQHREVQKSLSLREAQDSRRRAQRTLREGHHSHQDRERLLDTHHRTARPMLLPNNQHLADSLAATEEARILQAHRVSPVRPLVSLARIRLEVRDSQVQIRRELRGSQVPIQQADPVSPVRTRTEEGTDTTTLRTGHGSRELGCDGAQRTTDCITLKM